MGEEEEILAMPEPAPERPVKGKKPPAVPQPEPEALTEEDQQKIDAAVDRVADPNSRETIRSVLRPQGIWRLVRAQKEHLRSVEFALLIADRWSPTNKLKEQKLGPDGEIHGLPQGNFDSVDELENDAKNLASLNVKIATIWSMSIGASARAEVRVKRLKKEALKAVGEARRAGHLRGKLKTVDEIGSMADTVQVVKQAEEDLLEVREQEALLEKTYYSTKELAERLSQRAKGLRSEIHMLGKTGG